MNFDEALSYLLSLGHETLAMKLGLRNTELLLEALGNPQKNYAAVQIAGTNGKGSTAVMLDSICQAAGVRSALFTSPHLISITERIKIDGQEISETEFARLATIVRAAANRLIERGSIAAPPTFFEQVTAIALLAFAEARVELAILETGLGGRLDATTVAQAETIAITPIALDHQEYLGHSLAEIAAEKAAIIRAGVRLVVALQPAEAALVIAERSRACGVAPLAAAGEDCRATVVGSTPDGRLQVTFETDTDRPDRYAQVTLGLRGRHQIINAALAVRLAECLTESGFQIPRAAIALGLAEARHPGRLELRTAEPSLLFDGAHNLSGALALRDYLDEFAPAPVTMIFGAMRDKDIAGITGALLPCVQRLVLTQPDNPRALSAEELRALLPGAIDPATVVSTNSAADALRRAVELTPPDGLICVTGSLYLIGEVQALISQNLDPMLAPMFAKWKRDH